MNPDIILRVLRLKRQRIEGQIAVLRARDRALTEQMAQLTNPAAALAPHGGDAIIMLSAAAKWRTWQNVELTTLKARRSELQTQINTQSRTLQPLLVQIDNLTTFISKQAKADKRAARVKRSYSQLNMWAIQNLEQQNDVLQSRSRKCQSTLPP